MYLNIQVFMSLILAGFLILIRPALLNYIIGVYFIIFGVAGLVK